MSLSDRVGAITFSDLQPTSGSSGLQRTLLVNYICTTCKKVYKPWYEILAVVTSSTAALVGAYWAVVTFLAQLVVTWDASNPFVDSPEARGALDNLARTKSLPVLTRTQTPLHAAPAYLPISPGP